MLFFKEGIMGRKRKPVVELDSENLLDSYTEEVLYRSNANDKKDFCWYPIDELREELLSRLKDYEGKA